MTREQAIENLVVLFTETLTKINKRTITLGRLSLWNTREIENLGVLLRDCVESLTPGPEDPPLETLSSRETGGF